MKQNYEIDLRKRPIIEKGTYNRELSKRPMKEAHERDL